MPESYFNYFAISLCTGSVSLTQPTSFHPTQVEVNLPDVSSMLILEGSCAGGVIYNPLNVTTDVLETGNSNNHGQLCTCIYTVFGVSCLYLLPFQLSFHPVFYISVTMLNLIPVLSCDIFLPSNFSLCDSKLIINFCEIMHVGCCLK